MTDATRESLPDDLRDERPLIAAPVKPLQPLAALESLDLGDAAGLVCDIDDPDCAPMPAARTIEGDA